STEWPGSRSPGSCACTRPAWRLRWCATAMTSQRVCKARSRPPMLRTVVLAGLAGLVIAVDWLRFEEPRSGGGRPFVLVLLAIAPVLLRPLWLRLVGVAVAAVLAAWVAFSVSPAALWPGGQNFFGTVASRFGSGFADFY